MTISQTELDQFLDQVQRLPLEEHRQYPVPRVDEVYGGLLAAMRGGFEFSNRELLHAIGCKTAILPMSDQDECIKSAHKFVHVLDRTSTSLCFNNIAIPSDLLAILSQEMGVGMMCLVASKLFGVDWDQLGSIPGKGKRFDYRGPLASGGRGIFEAKGTSHSNYQGTQILDGIDKKSAHHDRGEHFDVELVVAAFVGRVGDQPRIVVADPDPNPDTIDLAFGPRSDKYYKYRHFARVLQFLCLPSHSRYYYLRSLDMLGGRLFTYRRRPTPPRYRDTLAVNGVQFVGCWVDRWLPPTSRRYKHRYEWEDALLDRDLEFSVFQGLREESFELLLKEAVEDIHMLSWDECKEYRRTPDGLRVSVLPDSTILAFKTTQG